MRENVDRWLRTHPLVVDAAIVAVLLLPALLSGVGSVWFDAVLLAPLVLRRRAPVVSFTLLSLLLLGQAVVDDPMRWGDVALLFGLYAIAAYGPRWAQWGGLATGVLGAVIAALIWPGGTFDLVDTVLYLAFLVMITVIPWLWGLQVRTRRSVVDEQLARAEEREREAAARARLAANAERARIAREMHDVVAHSLSVIVVQADGAAYAARSRPEAAVEALGTISDTGRRSLAEMRRLLGLLRGEADDDAERAPMPGGGDLESLVERVRANGVSVTSDVDADVAALPPATGLTVYRVVQEALTNTLKHAGPRASATVHVHLRGPGVEVEVEDDGRGGTAAQTGGFGLQGMRERIALHEGTVDAGPRPGGGFRVRATLPAATPATPDREEVR